MLAEGGPAAGSISKQGPGRPGSPVAVAFSMGHYSNDKWCEESALGCTFLEPNETGEFDINALNNTGFDEFVSRLLSSNDALSLSTVARQQNSEI